MLDTAQYALLQENWGLVCKTKKIGPVTISVPHDGLITADLDGFFEKRKIGYHGRDLHVWPIAKDILQRYPATAIRGLIPRAFVDYNRAWPEGINYYPLAQKEVHTAFDDARLVSAYRYYHSSLEQFLESSVKVFTKQEVLLIDLHGFAKQPPYAPKNGFDLILGTGNRITVPNGYVDQNFEGFMRKKGYKVFLPTTLNVGPVEDYYSADFITRHYSEKFNINVLQIEIASRFRKKEGKELGQKLSADIAEFLKLHYPIW